MRSSQFVWIQEVIFPQLKRTDARKCCKQAHSRHEHHSSKDGRRSDEKCKRKRACRTCSRARTERPCAVGDLRPPGETRSFWQARSQHRRTLGGHYTAFLGTRVTNEVIEAVNGILPLVKRMARGFRALANFRLMALLKADKLQFDLPALSPT